MLAFSVLLLATTAFAAPTVFTTVQQVDNVTTFKPEVSSVEPQVEQVQDVNVVSEKQPVVQDSVYQHQPVGVARHAVHQQHHFKDDVFFQQHQPKRVVHVQVQPVHHPQPVVHHGEQVADVHHHVPVSHQYRHGSVEHEVVDEVKPQFVVQQKSHEVVPHHQFGVFPKSQGVGSVQHQFGVKPKSHVVDQGVYHVGVHQPKSHQAVHHVGVVPATKVVVEPKHHVAEHDHVVAKQFDGQDVSQHEVEGPEASARIVQQEMEVNPDGSFYNVWNSDNGINVQEQGTIKHVGDTDVAVQNGEISYVDNEGKTFYLKYVADENGFRVIGDHIPTPPPIPQAIVKSLEFISAHPYVETTPLPEEQFQPEQAPVVVDN